jgi:signal transduction histidine kinase
MSHELRTPLNAVIGYAEILTEDLLDVGNDTGAEDAARIREAGRHLLALVGDVLDVARFDSNQLTLNVEETDVADVLREAAEAVRAPLTARGVQLDVQIARMTPMMCDAARLKQAVGNLLSNAVKFTPQGSVRLTAFSQRGQDGETLVVQVRDTGVGVRAEDVARLFQPFHQADNSTTRKFDGAGLGLVMTRNIARLMGGDVSAESAPGLGSTFTLRVPRRAAIETVRATA